MRTTRKATTVNIARSIDVHGDCARNAATCTALLRHHTPADLLLNRWRHYHTPSAASSTGRLSPTSTCIAAIALQRQQVVKLSGQSGILRTNTYLSFSETRTTWAQVLLAWLI